jgi:hypothetical protein
MPLPPPLDPVAACLDALEAHLQATILSGWLPEGYRALVVRQGWPEADAALRVDAGPLLTLTPVIDEGQRHAPVVVGSVREDDGQITVTERIGTVELEAQLDLWVAYAAQLGPVAGAVEAALDAPTGPPGLWLQRADGRPLNVDVLRAQREASAEGVAQGLWRCRWTLRLRSDRVRSRRGPAFSTFAVSGDIGGSAL